MKLPTEQCSRLEFRSPICIIMFQVRNVSITDRGDQSRAPDSSFDGKKVSFERLLDHRDQPEGLPYKSHREAHSITTSARVISYLLNALIGRLVVIRPLRVDTIVPFRLALRLRQRKGDSLPTFSSGKG